MTKLIGGNGGKRRDGTMRKIEMPRKVKEAAVQRK